MSPRAGEIFAALEAAVGAAVIGDEAARFLDQQHAGGRVPDVEVVFPEAVEPAGGDPGEIERRRAEAADAGNFRRDRVVDFSPAVAVAAAEWGMPVPIRASSR